MIDQQESDWSNVWKTIEKLSKFQYDYGSP